LDGDQDQFCETPEFNTQTPVITRKSHVWEENNISEDESKAQKYITPKQTMMVIAENALNYDNTDILKSQSNNKVDIEFLESNNDKNY
jgi:hypothetical protein